MSFSLFSSPAALPARLLLLSSLMLDISPSIRQHLRVYPMCSATLLRPTHASENCEGQDSSFLGRSQRKDYTPFDTSLACPLRWYCAMFSILWLGSGHNRTIADPMAAFFHGALLSEPSVATVLIQVLVPSFSKSILSLPMFLVGAPYLPIENL